MEDAKQGKMDVHVARGWVLHDLSWASYYEARSKGKRVPEPTISPGPVYTLEEAVELLPEDDDEALDSLDDDGVHYA